MKHRRAIIVFTRVPVPGQTKTRLMPYFTPKQCERLHSCMLQDIKGECEKVEADVFICYTPEDKEGKIRKILENGCIISHSEEKALGCGYT